jgi:hypothetical protein
VKYHTQLDAAGFGALYSARFFDFSISEAQKICQQEVLIVAKESFLMSRAQNQEPGGANHRIKALRQRLARTE